MAGAVGEVADRVAQLLADGPAEGDGLVLAGMKRVDGAAPARQISAWGFGEAGPAVKALGKPPDAAQARLSHAARSRSLVGLPATCSVSARPGSDLGAEAGEHGGQGAGRGRAAPSSPVAPRGADASRWKRPRGVGAAAVADAGQPGGQPFRRQPVGAVLAVEAARNARLIGSRGRRTTRPGRGTRCRCARSWLPNATRWGPGPCGPAGWRSVTVAGLSGISGRSRARSVRSVSASTNASNRSSLLPAEP